MTPAAIPAALAFAWPVLVAMSHLVLPYLPTSAAHAAVVLSLRLRPWHHTGVVILAAHGIVRAGLWLPGACACTLTLVVQSLAYRRRTFASDVAIGVGVLTTVASINVLHHAASDMTFGSICAYILFYTLLRASVLAAPS